MLRGNTGGSQDAFTDASRATESERAYRALAGPCANELDKRPGRVRLEHDLGEQGRIDCSASSRPVVEHGHVENLEELAFGCEERNRARHADINRQDGAAHDRTQRIIAQVTSDVRAADPAPIRKCGPYS
jgi:hypothetical protein